MTDNQANAFRFCHPYALALFLTGALIALLMEWFSFLPLNIDWQLPNRPQA
jgi:hypothetical protein